MTQSQPSPLGNVVVYRTMAHTTTDARVWSLVRGNVIRRPYFVCKKYADRAVFDPNLAFRFISNRPNPILIDCDWNDIFRRWF